MRPDETILSKLIVNPDINLRSSDTGIADLKAQIVASGFTDPITVREVNGLYEVIDGSRRLAAITELSGEGKWLAHWPIPVFIVEAEDGKARELALAANVVRAGLSPADEAVGFYRLKLSGETEDEIAARSTMPSRACAIRWPGPAARSSRWGTVEMDGSGPFTETYTSKNIDWAPHIEALTRLHAEGKSAAEIAAAIGHGLTRNAVIGKVHRLRLHITQPSERRPRRGVAGVVAVWPLAEPSAPKLLDGARPVKLKALPRVEKALQRERNRTATNYMTGVRSLRAAVDHTAPVLERFREGYLGQTGRLSLVELRDGVCKFPIEQADGPDRYCGLDAENGGAYCSHHAARCCDGIPAKETQPNPWSR